MLEVNSMLSVPMLRQIMPNLSADKASAYLPYILAGMAEFEIDNELRAAAYLSQLAHESSQLAHWVENLNYSPSRLCQVWASRFPTLAAAQPFAHNPEALANKVYNGRMGNRVGTADGWKFRGRMPMQATGRDMYELLSEILGVDLVSNPDLCLKPEIAFRASAAIFAKIKNCNSLSDDLVKYPNNFTIITKRINGGANGLAERLEFYKRARRVLPDNLQIVADCAVYALPAENIDDKIDEISLPEAQVPVPADRPEDDTSNSSDYPQNPSRQTVPEPQNNPAGDDSSAQGGGGDAAEKPARYSINYTDYLPFVLKLYKRVSSIGAVGTVLGGLGITGASIAGLPVGGKVAIIIIGGIILLFVFILIILALITALFLLFKFGLKIWESYQRGNPGLQNIEFCAQKTSALF
jgi:putative chitinase